MKYFTPSHEWIEKKGTTRATVGITEYIQKELGEIVYIQLPKVGQKVKKGDEICVLESTKAAIDLYAPVSGTVTAIQDGLAIQPSLLRENWIFEIELSDPQELTELLDEASYTQRDSEVGRQGD